jgi:hypothetical protein
MARSVWEMMLVRSERSHCKRDELERTDDGDHVLGSLELPEGDIDGDTTLTLGLELVENPGILEGLLSEFFGFLYFSLH